MDMTLGILILLNMAPHQKLFMALVPYLEEIWYFIL